VNPNQSDRNEEELEAGAAENSGAVTRRAALGMAFHQVLSAFNETKAKAMKAVAGSGSKLKGSQTESWPGRPMHTAGPCCLP
jgi:hypothetical protein